MSAHSGEEEALWSPRGPRTFQGVKELLLAFHHDASANSLFLTSLVALLCAETVYGTGPCRTCCLVTECTVSAGAIMHAGAAQGGISVLPSQYPPVYRDNVTDDFFGTVVADPYRWLENTDSPETLACELL